MLFITKSSKYLSMIANLKKITLMVGIQALTLAQISYAQNYNFSVTSSYYSHLNNAVSLTKGELIQSMYAYEIPMDSLNFSFLYNNKTFSKLVVHVDGYIEMGEINVSYPTEQYILPCYAEFSDLGLFQYPYDKSLSSISYKIEQGLSGNNVLKIEWKNMAFYNDSIDSYAYTSFQIWLYENTNDIEFHYGPNLVTNLLSHFQGAPGPIIGLIMDYDEPSSYWGNSIVLLNNPSNPDTLHYIGIANNSPLYLNGIPDENTVYIFSPLVHHLYIINRFHQKT